MVCPFHGWTYHLDGRLKQIPSPGTFAQLEIASNGLIPIELEVWHGFLFIRFRSGGQSLAARLAAVEEKVAHYRLSELLPLGSRRVVELPYNWKLIHDVDNEGYHVPSAHPSLHSLYGRDYRDSLMGDVPISTARVDKDVSSFWSVDRYKKLLPSFDHLPSSEQRVWFYFAVFPNLVFVLYPEMVEFYMTVPVSAGKSLMIGQCFGLQDDRRETRAARYLNQRINEQTAREDENLVLWLQESFATSVYPRDNLSTLEFGVAYFHRQLKMKLPVLGLERAPPAGHLAARTQKMLNGA
jgi:phenylpropionate dioxygenase-like ring-hydroxylating dioxygenase large terminal subunit